MLRELPRERWELAREGGFFSDLLDRDSELSRDGGFRDLATLRALLPSRRRFRCEAVVDGGRSASEFSRDGGFRDRERCEVATLRVLPSRQRLRCEVVGGGRSDSEFPRDGGFRDRERCAVGAIRSAAELLRDGGFREERERWEAARSADELPREGGLRRGLLLSMERVEFPRETGGVRLAVREALELDREGAVPRPVRFAPLSRANLRASSSWSRI